MLDINKHKFFLVSILKEIFSDIELSTALGFKGGTAQMLFYGLPRFSDIYYFMQQKTPVNKSIVEQRMNKEFKEYLLQCISKIEKVKPSALLSGLGELVDTDLKKFVKQKLKPETILLLKMYYEFPIYS